ncbi:MAG: peptidoglycan DD-metalloendopeptidase family protein [Nitriliruptoraceae bacterium]|nr:peptidoglycan DD-metalloendopeptidase family protein [Nitriliruptoraceae bacterium]
MPDVRTATSPGRLPWMLALAVACVLPLLAVDGSSAQEPSSEDIQRDLDRAEQEERELRGELGAVRDRLDAAEEQYAAITVRLEDARGRLVAAEGQVALGEEALAEAQQVRADAEAAHERAVDALAAAERRLEDEEGVLTDQLVHTFKYGSAGAQRGAMALEVLRRAQDPNDFAVGVKQLQTVVDVQDGTVRQVTELRADREDRADDAARARGAAVQAAADAAETLEVLEGLRAEAASVAAEVVREEEAQAALLASLELTASETASLVEAASRRTAALEEDLRAQRAAEEEARRRAAEEAAAQAAREAAERERRQASSGNGGSGSRGGGGTPGAAGGSDLAGIVCPVQGAAAGRDFINDWGFPRSGGRTHQGNDIFASTGTPVVAVQDGTVVRWNPPSAPTGLGGITVTYRTADNSEWYNAHLDTVAPGIEPGVSVSRGEIIGTVGQTGNARTTPPHLHIGRRQGGTWVNPWPTISPVC